MSTIKKILALVWILSFFWSGHFLYAHEDEEVVADNLEAPHIEEVHFFGRDDCKFCDLEKEFIAETEKTRSDINFTYYNIATDKSAKKLFNQITEANGIAKITPITLVGGQIIQGFNSSETTGAAIIRLADIGGSFPVEYYLEKRETIASGSGCDVNGDTIECEADAAGFVLDLPILGTIDIRDFSLFTLSSVLGFVDGFNPCAMWVLVTFLLILLQIGDRKKMFQVAGLFILAEAVMYYLILDVWYLTWDFVGLDMIVTPLVGILALGGGVFFLNKYRKSRKSLTCDVTSIEQQQGIEAKIKKLVHSPMTIATILGVVGLAFSVNVIEFACSIGIPQAFTKIIELNQLDFLTHQFYIFIYIIFYMVDDLVVFGIALYGFDKLHSSYKYVNASMLIGGILMIALGLLMLFAPDILVF